MSLLNHLLVVTSYPCESLLSVDAENYFPIPPLFKGPNLSLTRVMLPKDMNWFPGKQILALSLGRENGVIAQKPEHSLCQTSPSGSKKSFRVSIKAA